MLPNMICWSTFIFIITDKSFDFISSLDVEIEAPVRAIAVEMRIYYILANFSVHAAYLSATWAIARQKRGVRDMHVLGQ